MYELLTKELNIECPKLIKTLRHPLSTLSHTGKPEISKNNIKCQYELYSIQTHKLNK